MNSGEGVQRPDDWRIRPRPSSEYGSQRAGEDRRWTERAQVGLEPPKIDVGVVRPVSEPSKIDEGFPIVVGEPSKIDRGFPTVVGEPSKIDRGFVTAVGEPEKSVPINVGVDEVVAAFVGV